MPELIKRFNDELDEQLHSLQGRLDKLKNRTNASAKDVRESVHEYLEDLEDHIDKGRDQLKASKHEIENWADDKKETIQSWRERRHMDKLDNRAQRSESYANAKMRIALNAVQDAEMAMLQAVLARADAKDAHQEKAA